METVLEKIAEKHGLPIYDPIQRYHYENAMKEFALAFDTWLRVESGCTYISGVFWRNDKGGRVKIHDLFGRFLNIGQNVQVSDTTKSNQGTES